MAFDPQDAAPIEILWTILSFVALWGNMYGVWDSIQCLRALKTERINNGGTLTLTAHFNGFKQSGLAFTQCVFFAASARSLFLPSATDTGAPDFGIALLITGFTLAEVWLTAISLGGVWYRKELAHRYHILVRMHDGATQ